MNSSGVQRSDRISKAQRKIRPVGGLDDDGSGTTYLMLTVPLLVGRVGHYSKDAVQGRDLRHLVDVVTLPMKQQVTTLRPLPYVHKLSQRPSMDTLGPALAEAYRDGASVSVLRQQFRLSQGSILKLLAEHGVEMRQQGLSEEQIPTAVALYQEGQTIVQVAKRFGVAPQTEGYSPASL